MSTFQALQVVPRLRRKLDRIAKVHGEEHALDLAVDCSAKCGATSGDPCVGLEPGVVHFCRRLRRLMIEGRPRFSFGIDHRDRRRP